MQQYNSNNSSSRQYVYIIREREFIRLNHYVYKIGKTTQEPNSRLAGYPKGSEVLVFITVNNCHEVEKKMIALFCKQFTQEKQYGREYFTGDLYKMISLLMDLVAEDHMEPKKVESLTNDILKNSFEELTSLEKCLDVNHGLQGPRLSNLLNLIMGEGLSSHQVRDLELNGARKNQLIYDISSFKRLKHEHYVHSYITSEGEIHVFNKEGQRLYTKELDVDTCCLKFYYQDPLSMVLADPIIINNANKRVTTFNYTLGDRFLCKITIEETLNTNKIKELDVSKVDFANSKSMYYNIIKSLFAHYDREVLIITFKKGFVDDEYADNVFSGGRIGEFWRYMMEVYLIYNIKSCCGIMCGDIINTKLVLTRKKREPIITQFNHKCRLIVALSKDRVNWNQSLWLKDFGPLSEHSIGMELNYADILSPKNVKIGRMLMWKRKFSFITTTNDKIKIVFDQPIVLCTKRIKQDKFMKFIINHKDYMSETGEISCLSDSQKFSTLSRRDSICGGSDEFYIEIIYGFTYDVYNENKKDTYPYLNLNPMLERVYKELGLK